MQEKYYKVSLLLFFLLTNILIVEIKALSFNQEKMVNFFVFTIKESKKLGSRKSKNSKLAQKGT